MVEYDSEDKMNAALTIIIAAAYCVVLLCRSKRQRICRERSRSKRQRISQEFIAIQELASTIKETFIMIKSSRSLSFAQELFEECMKLKEYGYSARDIGKAYDYLMADDARARSFFVKDEELRRIWAEDFFQELRNQGEGSRGYY